MAQVTGAYGAPGTQAVYNRTTPLESSDTCLKILEFSPANTLSLRATSRTLKLIADEFLKNNKTEIVHLTTGTVGKVHALLSKSIIAHDNIIASLNPLPCHSDLLFHVSVRKQMLGLGVSWEEYPAIVMAPQEVCHFSDQIQTIQDLNLERIWRGLHQPIVSFTRRPLAGVPGRDAPAQDVRTWLVSNPRVMLKDAAKLNNLALTTVPREILLTLITVPQKFLFSWDPLPQEMVGFGLRVVDLSNNNLGTLPADLFSNLSTLEEISLNNNKLIVLPDNSFHGLNRLQKLSLSNNQLSILPATLFNGLYHLKRITLDCNRLTTLPDALFLWLTGLQEISLSHNHLTTLPDTLFRRLNGLQEISLSHNHLTTLPNTLFSRLSGLKGLLLSHNQLATLPPFLFDDLVQLERLSLDNNPLTTVPETLFRRQNCLEVLDLSHNQNLLILFNRPPVDTNHIGFRDMMHEFYTYNCISPFAEFYQHVAADRFPPLMRSAFANLDPTIKNGILKRVSKNLQDENHAFDDMQIFQRALKRYVRDSYKALNESQKMGVHTRVYKLAQEQNGPASNSGKVFIFYNILRLIDAIHQESLWLQ